MPSSRPQPEVEVAVIGAGAVGLAIAAVLSEHRSVAVIERHDSYGRENSSHNSGVIHAGLYYPADWLKTTLCVEGNRLLYAWAAEHGVRVRRTGKLVLALAEPEIPALGELAEAARANGVPDLRMLRKGELQSMEPAIRSAAALYSGSSGVIDQMELMRSYVAVARSNGAHFAFKHKLTGLKRLSSWFEVRVEGPDAGEVTLTAASVVNAAGLAADSVGQSLGYDPDGGQGNPPFRQTANRGCYYDVVNREKAAGIAHLIYPLPHSDRSGLGIHVTVDVDGDVHLGPDSEWLDEGARLDFRITDDRRLAFLQAARRYWPALESEDLAPGQVGYRPKLSGPAGPPADFLIWFDRGYVHLGGIESPGMTASLAIARRVREVIERGEGSTSP
ncbi:MAG: NAD(P)/FAD-dependent oxidoreductase [Dehalococcoidia bacterium]|nr:NAD(P)/FAD-dependent oxidoreductase [Dehalococcoidia bacterium]